MTEKQEPPSAETMARATTALATARAEYDRTEENFDRCARDRTAALNRLNDKQREFDELMAALRATAPRGSAWDKPVAIRVDR